jgi:hypothetical protein
LLWFCCSVPINFPVGITANQPLQNGQDIDFVAPGIVAGKPFGNRVNDAALEFQLLRQRWIARIPNAVTVQELNASRVRYVAVETNHAQITYGMRTAAVMAAIQALGNQQGKPAKPAGWYQCSIGQPYR